MLLRLLELLPSSEVQMEAVATEAERLLAKRAPRLHLHLLDLYKTMTAAEFQVLLAISLFPCLHPLLRMFPNPPSCQPAHSSSSQNPRQ
jgi:hypothetical protein